MKGYYVAAVAAMILALAGCEKKVSELDESSNPEERTTLSIGLAPVSRTSLGVSAEGKRKVYWTDGDEMSLNGVTSDPLASVPAECSKVSFSFPGVLTTPYKLLYPASFYKNATTITLPASQAYDFGTIATSTEPLAGYAAAEGDVTLNHLCCILELQIKKDAGVSASNIARVTFRGNADEQVSGDFTIDYELGTLTGASDAAADKSVTVTLDQALSTSTALEVYLVVPARTYASGFSVEIEDNMHRVQTKTKPSSATLTAGKLVKMTEFTFVPGALATEFTIEDVTEEVLPFDYNISGRVVDSSSNPIEGVVVSDGTQCVRTMFDGTFYMQSNTANVKYVQISTPSGYLPPVDGGKPRFYKAKADITPSAGIYDFGDFVLTPVANPNTFTLFVTADPQPRASNLPLDNVAYRSLRACESLYQDLTETAAGIAGRQVYGICLGDLVNGDMDLMDTYSTALENLGYPTYNMIGNHDYDLTARDDDAGAWKYEALFGPRNYSFNIGGIHFVVLDNLIMEDNGSKLKSSHDYTQGLTDEIWAWLQADMAFVPRTSTVMVFAHSPMFKYDSGSERTNTAKHGGHTNESEGGAYGYGDLFDEFPEVHAWAGHTHLTFNHVYAPSHRHKNVQVHTLARSTGELWTNEYLAGGTPRGFTIVEIVNGDVASWRFHPTKYLKSSFHGTNGQPPYTYCDWTYEGSSPLVAKMKDTGLDLDESYQMHVFPPDAYGDGKLYVNVFLWDSLWDKPTLTMEGGAPVVMTQVETVDVKEENRIGYDIANKEIIDFYNDNYSGTLTSAGYAAHKLGVPLTMFRVAAPASGTGTVSVTDRFGNTYSRTVSW